MSVVVVGPYRYTRRDYTPKRRGQEAGHGWLRAVQGASAASGRAEVSMEMKALVDEIVRLRAEASKRAALLASDDGLLEGSAGLVDTMIPWARSIDPRLYNELVACVAESWKAGAAL